MWCQPADKGEFCGNYEPISMQGNKFGTVKRCRDLITIGHKKTKKNCRGNKSSIKSGY